MVEILASYALKLNFEFRYRGHQEYLGSYAAWPPSLSSVLQDTFSFLLLYYYIIPMSLYVTIELYKFIGEYCDDFVGIFGGFSDPIF